MATREFKDLITRINPSTPGCPQETMFQYIRDAAVRACERTLAWRYTQPKFNLTAGIPQYNYNKPFDTEVHAVFAVWLNDDPLDRLTLDEAINRYPAWADTYTTAADITEYGSEPRAITQLSPHQFVVLPLPDAEKTYTMRMIYALKPSRTATEMDETIFNDLEEVIMHGALQHLLVLPNTNWSDRELASYHAKQFISQVTERRARANLGNSRGSLSVQLPGFA
jgi:hypothetical protein